MLRALLLSFVVLTLLRAQGDAGVAAEVVASPVVGATAVDPNLASVSGSVTDLAGSPVAGAIISITAAAARTPALPLQDSAPAPYSALSDAAGVFHIEGVKPGAYNPIVYH